MSEGLESPQGLASSYVEGVGDEVLLTAVFILAAISSIIFVFRPTLDWNPLFRGQHGEQQRENGTDDNTERDGPTVAAVRTNTRAGRRSGSTADSACPICLAEPIRHGIETNCGHLFCAQCLFTYRDHSSLVAPMQCALCRQPVTLLFPSFTEVELSAAELEEAEARDRARAETLRYNRRFSGEPRQWLEYLWDLPTLLRHLWMEFFSEGGLFLMFRVRVVVCFLAAFVYVASPLDILPEAVFGLLGLFDDVFIMILIAIYVSVIYRRYVAARV